MRLEAAETATFAALASLSIDSCPKAKRKKGHCDFEKKRLGRNLTDHFGRPLPCIYGLLQGRRRIIWRNEEGPFQGRRYILAGGLFSSKLTPLSLQTSEIKWNTCQSRKLPFIIQASGTRKIKGQLEAKEARLLHSQQLASPIFLSIPKSSLDACYACVLLLLQHTGVQM